MTEDQPPIGAAATECHQGGAINGLVQRVRLGNDFDPAGYSVDEVQA